MYDGFGDAAQPDAPAHMAQGLANQILNASDDQKSSQTNLVIAYLREQDPYTRSVVCPLVVQDIIADVPEAAAAIAADCAASSAPGTTDAVTLQCLQLIAMGQTPTAVTTLKALEPGARGVVCQKMVIGAASMDTVSGTTSMSSETAKACQQAAAAPAAGSLNMGVLAAVGIATVGLLAWAMWPSKKAAAAAAA